MKGRGEPRPQQGSSIKRYGYDEVMCSSLKRRNMSERERANIATLRNGIHYCVKASLLILLAGGHRGKLNTTENWS